MNLTIAQLVDIWNTGITILKLIQPKLFRKSSISLYWLMWPSASQADKVIFVLLIYKILYHINITTNPFFFPFPYLSYLVDMAFNDLKLLGKHMNLIHIISKLDLIFTFILTKLYTIHRMNIGKRGHPLHQINFNNYDRFAILKLLDY